MESDNNVVSNENAEERTAKKEPKHAVSLFCVRITACIIIFGGIMFVKFNSPCMFENFRFWYQNNMYEEKFSVEGIKNTAADMCVLVKEKALSVISKFNRQ
jgi:hypothetical protein